MNINAGFIVTLAFLVFVAVTIAKGVRIVPQGEEWIVERLGKYHGTLKPGLNIVIPYLDKVAYQMVTKDIILDVQEQEVITRDNAVILTNAIAFIKVTDPVKAVYGVTDFSEAIRKRLFCHVLERCYARVADLLFFRSAVVRIGKAQRFRRLLDHRLRHALDALVGQKILKTAVALAPLHRIGDSVCHRLRQSRRVGRIHSSQRLRELIVMTSHMPKRRRRFPSGGALSV